MESRVEAMYRRHARLYDATRRFILPARDRAIRRLDVRRGDLVLDFACGTGLNVPGLERAGAGSILGVDLSEAMLERARRKHPHVNFVRADLASADLGVRAPRVLCTWGLSLVPDPAAALRNLHRHLGDAGRLVLLDFDHLSGPLRPLDPLLRTWLASFGVHPPWAALAGAERLFDTLQEESVACGYARLLTGVKSGVGERHA